MLLSHWWVWSGFCLRDYTHPVTGTHRLLKADSILCQLIRGSFLCPNFSVWPLIICHIPGLELHRKSSHHKAAGLRPEDDLSRSSLFWTCTEELASRPQALGRDCGLSGTETSVGHPSRTEVQALESQGWEAQAG